MAVDSLSGQWTGQAQRRGRSAVFAGRCPSAAKRPAIDIGSGLGFETFDRMRKGTARTRPTATISSERHSRMRAVSTAIVVLAHEIPNELGDFAILLNSGYSRTPALLLNGLSESARLVGAFAIVVCLGQPPMVAPQFLAFCVGELRLRRDGRSHSGDALRCHPRRGALASRAGSPGACSQWPFSDVRSLHVI